MKEKTEQRQLALGTTKIVGGSIRSAIEGRDGACANR